MAEILNGANFVVAVSAQPVDGIPLTQMDLKLVWFTGTAPKIKDADANTSGTFANKPESPSIGFEYFCTDKQTTEGATNGIMIYHKGNDVWVDALGRVVE